MSLWTRVKANSKRVLFLIVFSVFCFFAGRCTASGDVGPSASGDQAGKCLSGSGEVSNQGIGDVDGVVERLELIERNLDERNGGVDQVTKRLGHIEQVIDERKRALAAREQAVESLIKNITSDRNLNDGD